MESATHTRRFALIALAVSVLAKVVTCDLFLLSRYVPYEPSMPGMVLPNKEYFWNENEEQLQDYAARDFEGFLDWDRALLRALAG
jgi:hypothetical protein